jgi:hypothetical protein
MLNSATLRPSLRILQALYVVHDLPSQENSPAKTPANPLVKPLEAKKST